MITFSNVAEVAIEQNTVPAITNALCSEKKTQLDQNVHNGSVMFDQSYDSNCVAGYTTQTFYTGASILALVLVLVVAGMIFIGVLKSRRRIGKK